jgi:hypothetical protein
MYVRVILCTSGYYSIYRYILYFQITPTWYREKAEYNCYLVNYKINRIKNRITGIFSLFRFVLINFKASVN